MVMTLLTQFTNDIKSSPLIFFFGINVFILTVMGTSINNAASTVFTVLVLTSLFYTKEWIKGWHELSQTEKIFVICFILYMLSGVLAFYNESDIGKYIRVFDRYFRFFLILPFYLLLVKRKISLLHYIYAGAITSGPFIFIIALNSYIKHPYLPAHGHYHHIMFGELAMLNIGVMLVLLLTHDLKRIFKIIILISMLCALIAAILSQTRGVWLMLPVYLIIAVIYAIKEEKIGLNGIAVFLAIFAAISILTPIGSLITKRVDSAVSNVDQYYTNNIYETSNGQRLALWDIALNVWQKHPLLGTGPGDLQHDVIALQNKGQYVKMPPSNSAYNIFIQALVGAGLIGFLIFVFAVVIMPLRVIFSKITIDEESRLFGFIVICAFSVFGLTESWTLRSPPVSVYLVYVTVMLGHFHSVVHKNTA